MIDPELRKRIRVAQRRSRNERECFVCGKVIPEMSGVYHADLAIGTHHDGRCDRVVDFERRDYTGSKRGKWRPRWEVLARAWLTRIACVPVAR